MSNTTFPMTAAPCTRSLAVHTCARMPMGTAAVISANAAELGFAVRRVDVPAYGFKQGRPPRGVPR